MVHNFRSLKALADSLFNGMYSHICFLLDHEYNGTNTSKVTAFCLQILVVSNISDLMIKSGITVYLGYCIFG